MDLIKIIKVLVAGKSLGSMGFHYGPSFENGVALFWTKIELIFSFNF